MTGLVGAVLALVGALVAAVVWGLRQGRKAAGARRQAEAWERLRAGQDAAAEAANSGLTPEEIARLNDGRY